MNERMNIHKQENRMIMNERIQSQARPAPPAFEQRIPCTCVQMYTQQKIKERKREEERKIERKKERKKETLTPSSSSTVTGK